MGLTIGGDSNGAIKAVNDLVAVITKLDTTVVKVGQSFDKNSNTLAKSNTELVQAKMSAQAAEQQFKSLTSELQKQAEAVRFSSTSLSSLTRAVRGETIPSLKEQAAQLQLTATKMGEIVLASDIYNKSLRGSASALAQARVEEQALNAEFAKTAKLKADLSLLSNTAYIAMQKENAGIREQIALKNGSIQAEAIAINEKRKAAAASAALTAAKRAEALAAKELNATLKTTAATTLIANTAQRNFHDTLRGVSGALGGLWMTYGSLIPLMSGFVAAGVTAEAVKQGAAFSYTAKMISVLDEEQGKAAMSAEEIKKGLLGIAGLRSTPTELAKGMEEFVKAGASASVAFKDIGEMSRFAKLGEMEMAEATKFVVSQANAFGETYGEVANKIGYAAAYSATSIQGMGTAMSHTAPLGTTLGFSLSEVAAALAILANKGIESSKAGTALTNTFLRLAHPTEQAQKVMKELGVSFNAFNSDGSIKSMSVQMEELSGVLSKLGKQDQLKLMAALSDLRSIKGLSVLTSEIRDMGDGFQEMVGKVDNAAKGVTFLQEVLAKMSKETKSLWEEMVAVFQRDLISMANMEAVAKFLDMVLKARYGWEMLYAKVMGDEVRILELSAAGTDKHVVTTSEKIAVLEEREAKIAANIANLQERASKSPDFIPLLEKEKALLREVRGELAPLNKAFEMENLSKMKDNFGAYAVSVNNASKTNKTFSETLKGKELSNYNEVLLQISQAGLSEMEKELAKVTFEYKKTAAEQEKVAIAAVKAGDITQEQADRARQALSEGYVDSLEKVAQKYSKVDAAADRHKGKLAELDQELNTFLAHAEEDPGFAAQLSKIEKRREQMINSLGSPSNYTAEDVSRLYKIDAMSEAKELQVWEKKKQKVDDFRDSLEKLQLSYGSGDYTSRMQDAVKELDIKTKDFVDRLKKEGFGAEEIALATEQAEAMKQQIMETSSEFIKLNGGPLKGFKAGLKEMVKELKTTGEMMFDFAKSTASNIYDTFSESLFLVMKGDFKEIGSLWEDLMMSILDAFLRTLAQMVAAWAATELFEFATGIETGNSFFGGVGASSLGGNAVAGVAGEVVKQKVSSYVSDAVTSYFAADAGAAAAASTSTNLVQGTATPTIMEAAANSGQGAGSLLSTAGGVIGVAGGAYGMYSGLSDIGQGNYGTGAVKTGFGAYSTYQGATTLGLVKEGTATQAYNAAADYVSSYFSSSTTGTAATELGTTAGTAMADAFATNAAADAAGTYAASATAAEFGTTATTATTSTSAGTAGTVGSTAAGVVGGVLMAALSMYGMSRLENQSPTRGSFGHVNPNELGPIGLSDSMTNITREQINAAKQFNMEIQKFGAVSLDAANGVLVATDAIAGPGGFAEGTKFAIYTWDEGSQTWYKGAEENRHLWDDMIGTLSDMVPVTEDATSAQAAYVAEMYGVPTVADELSMALGLLRSGMKASAAAAISSAAAMSSAFAGVHMARDSRDSWVVGSDAWNEAGGDMQYYNSYSSQTRDTGGGAISYDFSYEPDTFGMAAGGTVVPIFPEVPKGDDVWRGHKYGEVVLRTDTANLLDKKLKDGSIGGKPVNLTIPISVGNEPLVTLMVTVADEVATVRQRYNTKGSRYLR